MKYFSKALLCLALCSTFVFSAFTSGPFYEYDSLDIPWQAHVEPSSGANPTVTVLSADASEYLMSGGSTRIDFSISSPWGATGIKLPIDRDLDAFLGQSIVFYVKGSVYNPAVILRMSLIRIRPGNPAIKTPFEVRMNPAVVNQDNWRQVVVPLVSIADNPDGWKEVSRDWSTNEYTDIDGTDLMLNLANELGITFTVTTASPSAPVSGTIHVDDIYFISNSQLMSVGDVSPGPGTYAEADTSITAAIGYQKTAPRMIINDTEYTLADSELSYADGILTFTPLPGMELGDIVSVYVDAFNDISGHVVPMKAKEWYFFAGKENSGTSLIKDISLPDVFTSGMGHELDINLGASGNIHAELYTIEGRHLGSLGELSGTAGQSVFPVYMTTGRTDVPPGAYILTFTYDGSEQRREFQLSYYIRVR